MINKILNTFGSNVAVAIFNLLIAIIVSQYLGAAAKGSQSIIITTIALVLVMCNIAGGATLVFLIPRYKDILVMLPSYVWSIIVTAILYFFLTFFSFVPQQYVHHICILSLISSFTAINMMVLLGHERIYRKNFVAVIQIFSVVLVLSFLFFVQENKSIHAYIIALYAGYSLSFIVSILYVWPLLGPKSTRKNTDLKQLLKEMFRYGFLNQLSHIFQLLSIRLSYYFLLGLSGESSVGIYSNAVSLVESVWLISKSIATVQYARIANSNDQVYARTLTVKLLKTSVIISIVMLLPLLLLPAQFFVFLFGNEFGSVGSIILFLAPGIIIYNLAIIIGHYFSGRGQYHINTFSTLIGLLSTLILCPLLISYFNIYGAALATVFSFTLMGFFVSIVFIKQTKISWVKLLPAREDFVEARNLLRRFLKR